MIPRPLGKAFTRLRGSAAVSSAKLLDYRSQQPREDLHVKRYFVCLSPHVMPHSHPNVIFGFGVGLQCYSHVNASCSKCGLAPGHQFKCSHCGALNVPPLGTTFFEILEQGVKYDLIEGDLKKTYRKLQSEFHPDKYSQRDELERQKSEEISAIINKAYFTLVSPYERGMYLLELQRIPFIEGDIQLGSAFLAQIMEKNEELEDISTKERLEQFEKSNEIEIQKLSAKVSNAFLVQNFESAKSDLSKMKYFLSIRNRLKEMLRNM